MSAVRGKDQILLFRLLKDATTDKGTKLAFQTEHSVEISRDSESTETKDGPITTSKGLEDEIPVTSILDSGDKTAEAIRKAINENEVMELWEVDISENKGGDKFPAEYRQGVITEFNKTATAEDLVELEFTFKTNGTAQKGEVTLTKEQQEVVQYKFRDTEIHVEA